MAATDRAAASAAGAGRAAAAPGRSAARVSRSRRSTRSTLLLAVAALAAVVALADLPYATDPGTSAFMTNVFILLAMASMWNLLAGYAGLVSVGQQAFVGLGAYGVLLLALNGVPPLLAVPLAAVICGALALPISWLVFRLRGGYFAIGTWVVAEVIALLITRVPELGGGTGATVPGLDFDPAWITAFGYWAALAVAVACVGAAYLVLRSRVGLALTAIRDNETGARSLGVRVDRTKRIVYLVAAAGTGAAGALLAVSQPFVQAASVFNVQWSAYMIFVVIIGGIGSIEGPIVGTIVFFALQQSLAQFGAWYLIVVGAIAIAVALWAPRGLWGAVAGRLHVSIFSTGFFLRPAAGAASPEGDGTAAARARGRDASGLEDDDETAAREAG